MAGHHRSAPPPSEGKLRKRSFGAAIVSFLAVFFVFVLELVGLDLFAEPNDWTPVLAAALGLSVGGALVAWLTARWFPRAVAIGLPVMVVVTFVVRTHMPALGVRFLGWALAAVVGLVLAWILARVGRAQTAWALATATAVLLAVGVAERERGGRAVAATGSADLPDIILLVMDTTRRDRLGCYGYEGGTTPNLDALASTSAIYDDAWSVSPWTPPSHASMLTGLLPAEHGVDGGAQPRFNPDVATLPAVLRAAGYATAGFPANPNLVGLGWERGFDVFHPPWTVGAHSTIALMTRLGAHAGDGWQQDKGSAEVFRRARSWWGSHESGPRFLFLNLIDPHRPYDPPDPFYAHHLGDLDRAVARKITQDPVRYHVSPGIARGDSAILNGLYDAEVESMDAEIGAFLAWMSQRGELDGTILAITADHGERLGERGLVGHDLVMDAYLLRVPLVLRCPSRIPAGRVAGRVRLDGLAGRLLSLAGVAGPDTMMARALEPTDGAVAVAQYQDPEWFVRRCVARDPEFRGDLYGGDWLFVARGPYAFLKSTVGPGARGMLIDMTHDPTWSRDVTAEHPEAALELTELAHTLPRYTSHVAPAVTLAARERLRSLGYID